VRARPTMEDVYQFVETTECVIGFCDAEGRLIDLIGSPTLLATLTAIGWGVGSCWNEECAGTNGVALALLDAFPMQVSGESHYCAALTPYCTSAAPAYDTLGSPVGAVIAITPAAEGHLHTLGMVSAAANALTSELRMNLWLTSANERLTELHAILQTLSEGIILLRPDGVIAQMTAHAGRLLNLAPARVTGRRLGDIIGLPGALTDALRVARELHDEELIFRVGDERITCLCTLRPVAPSSTGGFLPDKATPTLAIPEIPEIPADGSRRGFAPPIGQAYTLRTQPRAIVGCFVLTLRSIERAQRLAHRMMGTQARMRFNNIIGQSPALLDALRLAHIAAEGASAVLLHGETGVGKEIFAQSIHNASPRAEGPFVAINCAAIPRELINSELFGYESGAGGERSGRPGKFELANGGTLFLDEIGDMPHDLQASLLRAIAMRSIVRAGGQRERPVDVRIIAATHTNLPDAVRSGAFRSDLYFRLNAFPIEIPPLRERAGDLPLLVEAILLRLSIRLNRHLGIEAEALTMLESYAWPGNIRELENVIERAVYISERGVIEYADLPENIRAPQAYAMPLAAPILIAAEPPFADFPGRRSSTLSAMPRHETIAAIEAAAPTPPTEPTAKKRLRHENELAEESLIRRMLRERHGALGEVAQALGVSRSTLWRKMRRYGI